MFKNILLLFIVILIFVVPANAQWRCLYATYDDASNGTGHNTAGAAALKEDQFVAIVNTPNSNDQNSPDFWISARNFLVSYTFADSAVGRLNDYGYGGATSGIFEYWSDDYSLQGCWNASFGPQNKLYVANNDTVGHSILVYDFDEFFGLTPSLYRMRTGSDYIIDVDVDVAGYVYVMLNGDTLETTEDVKIFKPLDAEGSTWATTQDEAPVITLDVPGVGYFGGITVSGDGSQIFVSSRQERKVQKFVGSVAGGFAIDAGFGFQLAEDDTLPNGNFPHACGIDFYDENNLLCLAVDRFVAGAGLSNGYNYGFIHIISPFTGAGVDTIDVAMWNFLANDSSYYRISGIEPGNSSGYTSTYDVSWDDVGNIYSQSHYGWTVEKWHTDNLPMLTAVKDEPDNSSAIPENFELEQNYPNPFNPTTQINFTLKEAGNIELTVYDINGRLVKTLESGNKKAGKYIASWDGSDNLGNKVASGIYFYRLKSEHTSMARRMILLQ